MTISTSRRLAGLATMTIDGVAYDIVGDCVYLPTMVKRETVMGQARVEGFSEMPQAGHIAATIRDNGSLSVAFLNSLVSSTILLQPANGKTVIGSGMWNTEASEVKTQEGTFSIKFESDDVTEITH